ncbi:hypothetical protein KCP70_19855 [Salmonella enterica subsp. enterica]|nr:hypothetical protein KCP70_19855 [Salmonella enterica subsp. enterica]
MSTSLLLDKTGTITLRQPPGVGYTRPRVDERTLADAAQWPRWPTKRRKVAAL